MMLVAPGRADKRVNLKIEIKKLSGFEKLKIAHSVLPAITHIDYSARIQTVDKKTNGFFYDMIKAFYDLTGCPVVINTSFNVRGEPIVCTPQEAYIFFMQAGWTIYSWAVTLFYYPQKFCVFNKIFGLNFGCGFAALGFIINYKRLFVSFLLKNNKDKGSAEHETQSFNIFSGL